jgi:hypothetical protein
VRSINYQFQAYLQLEQQRTAGSAVVAVRTCGYTPPTHRAETEMRRPPARMTRQRFSPVGTPVMSLDEIKKRFVDEVKLRGYDDRYIDKIEEREILHIAIQQGIGIEPARGALAQVCEREGYVLESTLLKLIKDRLESAAGNDGKIDLKEFDTIFADVKMAAQSRRNDRELKKMIILVMEDTGLNRVKTGWFSDWYSSLKRDLGMV